MSSRLRPHLHARSTRRDASVPNNRTPSRRPHRPTGGSNDRPLPIPRPFRGAAHGRKQRISPAATCGTRNPYPGARRAGSLEARLRRLVLRRRPRCAAAQTSGTPPRSPFTHSRDRDQPRSAFCRRSRSTTTRRIQVRPELVLETVNSRTPSSCNGRPSRTDGLCVVSKIWRGSFEPRYHWHRRCIRARAQPGIQPMIRVVHGTEGRACFVPGNYREKQGIQGAFGSVIAGEDVPALAHEPITEPDHVTRRCGRRRER